MANFFLNDTSNEFSMKRLMYKQSLLTDCGVIYGILARNQGSLDFKFSKMFKKSVFKDAKGGLKQINKKIPIYIELPSYKQVSNGSYKKEEDKRIKKDNSNLDDEIFIEHPDFPSLPE